MQELMRLIAEAEVLAGGKHKCAVLGHNWRFSGGRNCGCEFEDGSKGQCSIPVYQCDGCGDYDYGDNDEAKEKSAHCAALES